MKIKIVAIITVVILIVTYVPVYAKTEFPELPADVWEYWVIVESYDGYYRLLTSHEPFVKERYGLKLYATDEV